VKPFIPPTEPNSFILRSSVRLLFIALNGFALYLTFKGHNHPGGGFIGGLVSALSLVLVAMVMGVEKARKLLRMDPFKLVLLGLFLAFGTGLAAMFSGGAFLQHYARELHVPGFGHLHLLSAQLFDLGVYFVVVGTSTKIMTAFTLSVQLRDPFPGGEEGAYSSRGERPIETTRRPDDPGQGSVKRRRP
jgi:multisubunit Na+/H+ antiporter MnhB subunit